MKHLFALPLWSAVFYLVVSTTYAAKQAVIYDQDVKYKVKSFKVQKADGLVNILQRHGLSANLAARAQSNNPFDKDFRLLAGQRYLVKKALAKDEIIVRLYCPYTANVYELHSDHEQFHWSKDLARLDIEVQFFSGKVDHSILSSIGQQLDDPVAAYRFLDAYQMDYKIKQQLQRGAFYSLLIEKEYDEGHFIRYGEILNTQLQIGEGIDERNFIRYPGGGAFVGKKDTHADRFFYSPVDLIHISSLFKPRRFHPIRRRSIAHLGVDFALPETSPVYSPAEGKVVKRGKTRAAGNFVVIQHKNQLESYYNHLHSIDSSIVTGKIIKPGERIGKVGCTGYCTMSHLHFAVKKKGRFIDPVPLTRSYPFHQRALFEHRSLH